MGELAAFDEAEIRAAERTLEAALEDQSWVFEYTEDAVFDAGGDHVVEGREALLAMASGMQPLSAVSLRPRRTEGCGSLAAVWYDASWLSGPADSSRQVEVRGLIVWRKQSDGHWRVALEHIA